MAQHPVSCSCGTVKGTIESKTKVNHCVCYCVDCQTFAHFLGRQEDVLTEDGGTQIVQLLPRGLKWNEGLEEIACMKLSPKGTMRWYAKCCNTPLANTVSPKIPFIGAFHSILGDTNAIQSNFGQIQAHVNTEGASGGKVIQQKGMFPMVARFLWKSVGERLTGRYKQNPFFPAGGATPLVAPVVISKEERQALRKAVTG